MRAAGACSTGISSAATRSASRRSPTICKRRDGTTSSASPGLRAKTSNHAADVYMKAERAIIVYGMGITQHRRGAQNVQQLANLACCAAISAARAPASARSAAIRTCRATARSGITEVPSEEFLDRLKVASASSLRAPTGTTSSPRLKQ